MSVMVKNKTNKNYKRGQRGRSMVEMLGVLSIIGVLSVGGISAYGVAMKKHKANELLHQASMLATTISAQAMTNDGALPQTITSFGNSSYGNFSPSVTDALNGKGFSITIENVDSGACTQLEKMAGGMVRDVDCDEATGNTTITYYKNLATDPAEGEKSPTGGDGNCFMSNSCSVSTCDEDEEWRECYNICWPKIAEYFPKCSENVPLEDVQVDLNKYTTCRKDGYPATACGRLGLWGWSYGDSQKEFLECMKKGGSLNCCEDEYMIGKEYENCFA